MLTFREYLLEYANKSNALHRNATTLATNNGKDPNRINMRKYANTKPMGDSHKSVNVNKIIKGNMRQINLAGDALINTLNEYGVDYEEGTVKGLGNSGVEVVMFVDETGHQRGTLRKKQDG